MQTARGTNAACDFEAGSGGDRLRESRGAQRPQAIGPDLLLQNRWADVGPLDDADFFEWLRGVERKPGGDHAKAAAPAKIPKTCHSRRLRQAQGHAQRQGWGKAT